MSGYENHIMTLLRAAGYEFEMEKTFEDLRQGKFRFDFYVNDDTPFAIESDGPQHFTQTKPFHQNRTEFLHYQENDRRKNSYCLAHNIPLYRIPFWDIMGIESVEEIFQDKYRVKSKWHNDNLWREHAEGEY